MSSTDRSGPAFPVHPGMAAQLGCVSSMSDAGMSLRDFFAAKAMQEAMSWDDEASPLTVAATAYQYADAMLAARRAE